jgi:hypothetical protein
MTARIIDPQRMLLSGAVIEWRLVGRQHKQGAPADELAKQRGISTRGIQLRWLLSPEIGLPTEAFKVWKRPSRPMEKEAELHSQVLRTIFGWTAYVLENPVVYLNAQFQVNSANATVVAYAGAPFSSAVIDWKLLVSGIQQLTFSGPAIVCIVVSGDADLRVITGITGADASGEDAGWQLIERVGLPVDMAEWAGVFALDAPQGIEGALTDPISAAKDRFRRGAPLYGWDEELEPGNNAPPWMLANPDKIIKAMQEDLLGSLKSMITTTLAPQLQHEFVVENNMAINATIKTVKTRFAPISILMLGASSDPLFSLIAGFGTAYDDDSERNTDTIPTVVGISSTAFSSSGTLRSGWDYMVTARYEKGIDGNSEPVEYAAIIRAPKFATLPPKPANLTANSEGVTRAAIRDNRWRSIVSLAWDKIPDMTPFRIASFALARTGIIPAAPVQPLMNSRKYDPFVAQPISATTSIENENATGKLQALDESYEIDSRFNPNIVRYGIANQDLFGLWSGWSAIGHQMNEPAAQSARIVSALLDVVAPASPLGGGSICTATLVVDISWDWTVRSPEKIILVGRLYQATRQGEPPSVLSIPPGLQMSFPGGAGVPLTITFAGNDAGVVSIAGASVQYVSNDGKDIQDLPFATAGARRYRLTIPGFSLDYASAGHLGIALWAKGQEHLAPQREGPWSYEPSIATTSDPRPPVITTSREDVELASLADGRGEHRVKLDWPPMPGAVGYFIYETTESKLRAHHDLGEPAAGLTLSQRLAELRQVIHVNPSRRPFTRVNSTPLSALDIELMIPRGSKEIHLYLVLGVSAGQVESAWPGMTDPDRKKRFRAFAAPQVVPPVPPTLEVSRDVLTTVSPHLYRAKITIRTRPGATVTRVDLHRVRVPEAALAVDTMGPPVASITGSNAAWTVIPSSPAAAVRGENQPIGTIAGFDEPQGSWKRVFYRAVTWSGDDAERGLYGSRSKPSAAISVVVPPPSPPDLDPIALSWPGGPLTDVLFNTICSAPVETTELGPHRIKVEAMAVKPDGSLQPLYAYPADPSSSGVPPDDRLESVPTVAGTGLWREAIAGGNSRTNYQIRLSKASVDDAVRLRIIMTDPLGRSTEQVIQASAGSPLPSPDIIDPSITPVPGKGFILGFSTSVPIPATPAGPYSLSVDFAPDPRPFSFPFPPMPPGRPTTSVSTDLQNIELVTTKLPGPIDPFADHVGIPLRRGRTIAGITPIGVFLRSRGQLGIKLQSPDGRIATLNRRVG